MALKAIIPSGMTEITVNGLHQWDYGQQLEIHASDLPGLVEVHFACAGMNDAVVRPCDMVGGVGTVTIPDACLEQTAPIMAWVYEKDGAAGATVKTITLRVTPRARPTASEAPPPEVIDPYTEAVTAMNEAVGKVTEGKITAAKAIKAETDISGNKLKDTYYHLNPVTDGNDKYLIGPEVNIDKICMPSMCGVYTIDWETIENYDIPTLPDDIPAGKGAGKLIVEADYNVDGETHNTVFQTLKMRVLTADANQRLMFWTRQCVDGTWSRWLRHVSAEELTEGTLVAKKASCDKAGRPFENFLYGGSSAYEYLQEYAEDSPAVIKGGMVSLKLVAYNDNSFTTVSAIINVMVDLAYSYGQDIYSQAFYLPSYNLKDGTYAQHPYRLYFEFFTTPDEDEEYSQRMSYYVYIDTLSDDGSYSRQRLYDKNVKLYCKYLTMYPDEIGG
jgi:hypothetical protein